jgi:photosystem II stability/assembly factor-like uncharacterized protein
MADALYRYPGAQPFRDDEFSRRTFFGREPASMALIDQILANRLVVVYAKSGLGKTSLLNAGVAPRLREADSLPLFVRVNDIQRGPMTSLLEGIRAEAERQHVEYVPGDSTSLWSFFKSVEFWRGDLLLSPVLIVDQFEELFTLQSEEEREKFLSELSYLVRGIAPPQPQTDSNVSNSPPAVHVVLSLREDFLGLLEEASDRIPEIMDHRFRLAPLTFETAAKAITGPAAIDDPNIATRPFRLEPEFVTSILDYLSKSTAGARISGSRYVEPFHLQLICQRIEKIVALKQTESGGEIVLSSRDIGGEAALAETLASFYTDAIRSLPWHHRGAVRLLCEQFLISPEGRRLSLEEHELQRQLKLPRETLSLLVERRLLRTDRRSDSTYYELSHDALVQPVLASRRMQALALSWVALLAGWLTLLLGGGVIVMCVVLIVSDLFKQARKTDDYVGGAILIVFGLFVVALGRAWIRAGLRRRKRYRRRTAGESASWQPSLLTLKERVLAWVVLVVGSTLFTAWGLASLYAILLLATLSFTHGKFPHWLTWAKDEGVIDTWQDIHDRPFVEILWIMAEISAIVGLGWLCLRRSAPKLWPDEFAGRSKASSVININRQPSLVMPFLKVLSGIVALCVAALCFVTIEKCGSVWHGHLPYRVLQALMSYEVSDVCQTLSIKHYPDPNAITFVLFVFCAFALSVIFLRSGIREIHAALRSREFSRQVWVKAIAVASGILIIGPLLFWVWSRSPINENEGKHRPQAASVRPSRLAWAAGKDATVLNTEDGGHSWRTQVNGTGWLTSITFPTPVSGWVAGPGGVIWRSDDGGETWNVQASGTTKDLSVLSFVTPQSGWVVGADGTILHTGDGGASWQPQISGTDKGLNGLTFHTLQLGWAVGVDGTILHTQDGGSTWKRQTSGTHEDLSFISFVTAQSGWAAGGGGTILHTDDGGHTWKAQTSGTIRDLIGLAFVTPESGWVVGHHGTILHTYDAGKTWTRQTSGTREDLYEAGFSTPESGFAVGHHGAILHTDDGGETWILQLSGTSADLQSVTWSHPRGSIGLRFSPPPKPGAAGSHGDSTVSIEEVLPGGPAERAGLKAGDAIVSVNGKPVKTPNEVVEEISILNPGTEATVDYLRIGKLRTANVTIADYLELFPNRQ